MANIFQKVIAIRDAINYGEHLAEPGVWSNRSAVASALVGLLGLVSVFMPSFQISAEDAQNIAAGIAAVGGIVNAYLHVASNPHAGLRRKD